MFFNQFHFAMRNGYVEEKLLRLGPVATPADPASAVQNNLDFDYVFNYNTFYELLFSGTK